MTEVISPDGNYNATLSDVVALLEEARRSVKALMTATYWLIGRQIVESEQGGTERAAYGQALLEHLSVDLTRQFNRGFGKDNLELMRLFYQTYPSAEIAEPVVRQSGGQVARTKTESLVRQSALAGLASRFPLS